MRTRTTILAGIAVVAGMVAVPTASAAEQLAVADGNRLQLVNPDGSRARTLVKVRDTEAIDDVAASRDGRRVAYVVRSANPFLASRRSGLFIVRRSGRDEERLATGEAADPDFSRNDEQIAARINGDLRLLDADGRGQERVLRESKLSVSEVEVTRGGRIALIGRRGDNRFGTFSVRSDGRDLRRLAANVLTFPLSVPRETGAPVLFTRSTPFGEGSLGTGLASVRPNGSALRDLSPGQSDDRDAFFSDDGEHIVYVTEDNRRLEIMAADGSNRRPVLSAPPPPPGDSAILQSPRLSPSQSHVAFGVDIESRFNNDYSVRIARTDGSEQVVVAGPDKEPDDGQSFDWLP